MFAAAAVIGMLVGLEAPVLLLAVGAVSHVALGSVVGYNPAGPAGEPELLPPAGPAALRPWLLVPVAMLGGLAVGCLARRAGPSVTGAGTNAVVEAYHEPGGTIPRRAAVLRPIATALTIGTGGSGGREGPLIQAGAAVASWLSGSLRLSDADRRILLAAGMGAGVAAAFRAPLAGALFAAEVMYRSEEFESGVLMPAATAALTAAWVSGLILGHGPILTSLPANGWGLNYVPAYAAITLVMVVLARLYIGVIPAVARRFRTYRLPAILRPAVGAGLAALLGVGLYLGTGRDERALGVLGFGVGPLQELLLKPAALPVALLIALALGKLLTTALTVGSGGSAGLFGPALVVGGCAAAALGVAAQPLGPNWVPPPTAFALLGMAGFFSAAARVPISTLVIVAELTGQFSLLAPALGVCVACFALSGSATIFPAQRFGPELHRKGETQ